MGCVMLGIEPYTGKSYRKLYNEELDKRISAEVAAAHAQSPDRWESVSGNEYTIETARIEVPGGWIYRYGSLPGSCEMVFVPKNGRAVLSGGTGAREERLRKLHQDLNTPPFLGSGVKRALNEILEMMFEDNKARAA
jgi:hypothetical protein